MSMTYHIPAIHIENSRLLMHLPLFENGSDLKKNLIVQQKMSSAFDPPAGTTCVCAHHTLGPITRSSPRLAED